MSRSHGAGSLPVRAALVAVLLLATGCGGRPSEGDHADHGAGEHGTGSQDEEEARRGPHGGRLLRGENLDLEVTLFDRGMPPELRVYPFSGGRPVSPDSVDLAATITRLGGRSEEVRFQPEGDYLRGDVVVREPHSFDVALRARSAGRDQDFRYAQIEGRVELSDEALARVGIEIGTAGPRELRVTTALPGEVTFNRDRLAHVVARLAGVVTEIPVSLGSLVKKGELLAGIDSRELAEAKSEYIASIHRLEYVQRSFVREERLWRRGIAAEREYLRIRHELEEAEIARQIGEQKLLSLGVSQETLARLAVEPEGKVVERSVRSPFADQMLTRYEVRAPFDGEVIEKDVAVGEAVVADATLFVVSDLTSLWVEFFVYPKDLPRARPGEEVRVVSKSPPLSARGRISYLGALVGEASRTAKARVDLPNPEGRWRPGLFVTVELIESQAAAAVAVPIEAVQDWRGEPAIFVRWEDVFEIRPVALGRRDGTWVEVDSGLEPGERYAERNAFVLKAELGKAAAEHDH